MGSGAKGYIQEFCFTITLNNLLTEVCFSSLGLGIAGSGDLVPKGEILLEAPPGFVGLQKLRVPLVFVDFSFHGLRDPGGHCVTQCD